MKKLALLLAALSVASVSYAKEVMPVAEVATEPAVVEEVKAAPVLRVTSVGQFIEVDNTSNNSWNGYTEDVGEGVHFGNTVSLALGDNWTFDLMARKTWTADTDDGMESAGHRIDLSATRHFENFSIGLKWRGESGMDRFYIPVSYNYGMFSGWATPAYTFENTTSTTDSIAQDYFYLEAEPVVIKYGPFALSYYFEGSKDTGDADTHSYDHQVRLKYNFYNGEKLSLGAEYWYQFAYENVEKDETQYENNKHVGVLNAAYAVTENLTIDGYYRYDFNKYEAKADKTVEDDYYGEFYVGWTYTF